MSCQQLGRLLTPPVTTQGNGQKGSGAGGFFLFAALTVISYTFVYLLVPEVPPPYPQLFRALLSTLRR